MHSSLRITFSITDVVSRVVRFFIIRVRCTVYDLANDIYTFNYHFSDAAIVFIAPGMSGCTGIPVLKLI